MHRERRPTNALVRLARRLMTAAIVAVGMAFAAGAARAQSLTELYEAARQFDAAYLAARALADSAQYRVAQVEALRRPSASLGATISRSEVDRPARERIGSTGSDVTISGRHPLFNRPDRVTIEQAYKSLDVAQADLQTAEQELIVRLSQAYFDVLAAQDTLAFTRASKAAITEQLASAKRNFEVGTATITDTREAQARFDLATAQEIAAENDLRTRRAALDQLVGRAGVEPKPLAGPVEATPLALGSVDDWLGRADADHPSVRRARLNLEVAQLETDKAESEHLPTVDLVGSVGGDYTNRGTVTSPSGTTRSASVGVQLNVPLYTGRSIENRIKETLLLEERSRNDLEAARRSVALQTRQVFLGVQSGQAQVQALEAAESSSQLALDATQLGYKVGVRVNLDVLNAQTQLFETRRDLARARYDVLVNSLRLRQAAGTLSPQDLQPVNALLVR
jgi:outer membrane protein